MFENVGKKIKITAGIVGVYGMYEWFKAFENMPEIEDFEILWKYLCDRAWALFLVWIVFLAFLVVAAWIENKERTTAEIASIAAQLRKDNARKDYERMTEEKRVPAVQEEPSTEPVVPAAGEPWVCTNCKRQNISYAKACWSCNTPKPAEIDAQWTCSACQKQNRQDAKFCVHCGTPRQ